LLATAGGESLGVILIGNGQSRRPFTSNEAKLCQAMAEQVVTAIQNTRRYRLAQDKVAEMTAAQNEALRASQQSRSKVQDLSDRLASAQVEVEGLRQARDVLELKLASSRAETDALTRRLAVLEIDLSRQQEQLPAGSRVLKAGVLLTDAAGTVRATNSTAEVLLKRDRDGLRDVKLEAISHDAQWHEAVAAALAGAVARLTVWIEGNAMFCDMAPFSDLGEGRREVKGLAVVLQELSTEAQPTRLETLATMVEELRAPMATIIGYADLLLSEAMGVVGDAQRKFLLRIKASAEVALQRLQDLSGEVGGEVDRAAGPLEEEGTQL
jgi:signal transduction histidine kinase